MKQKKHFDSSHLVVFSRCFSFIKTQAYTCIYMHTYTGTCTHMYTCARAHKHTHTHIEQAGTQSTLCFTVVTAVSTHMSTHAHAHTCSYTHVHTHIYKEAVTRSTLSTFHGSDSSKRCPAIKAWSWRLCRRLCGCPSLWLLWEHLHCNSVYLTSLLETNALNRTCHGTRMLCSLVAPAMQRSPPAHAHWESEL